MHMQRGRRAPLKHLSCYVVWQQRVSSIVCFLSGRRAPGHFVNGRRAPRMQGHLQNDHHEQYFNVCGRKTTTTMQSTHTFAHAYFVPLACNDTLHCCFGQYACDKPMSLPGRLTLRQSSDPENCPSPSRMRLRQNRIPSTTKKTSAKKTVPKKEPRKRDRPVM